MTRVRMGAPAEGLGGTGEENEWSRILAEAHHRHDHRRPRAGGYDLAKAKLQVIDFDGDLAGHE